MRLNLRELVLCFYPVTRVDICIREGSLYKKQKAVNRDPVYGAPLLRGVLPVPSENSAPPGVPLPIPGRLLRKEMMKEGWSGKMMLSGSNGRFGEETLIPRMCFPLFNKCPPHIQVPAIC